MLRLAGPYSRENGDCPYLPDRQWAADYLLSMGDIEVPPLRDLDVPGNTFEDAAVRLPQAVAPPSREVDGLEVFTRLLNAGFRRAGRAFYRPTCTGCSECVSLRVDVDHFALSGDQKRALRKNRDVALDIGLPTFSEEKFEMYRRFVEQRYPGDDLTISGYNNFFLQHVGNTREFRYRVGDRLVGLGFIDLVRDGISSVYFFFDPDESARSLGTYSALREVDFCRQTSRKWLYMGFRVAGCKAMSYKSRFRPHQLLSPTRGWIPEADW